MIPNTPVVHIATTFDRNFLTPFYVLLASIFENNKGDIIHIHVLSPDLTEDDKTEMVKYTHDNHGELSFHEPDPSRVLRLPTSKWYPTVGFFRLFLPEILQHSGIEKIIYIDTDVVVVGRLLELYSKNFGTYAIGVAIERNATKNRPDLGLLNDYTYFNTGIMMINIPEWIKQDVTEKALDYMSTNPNLKLGDQDALNVLLEGNFMPFDNKFNVLPQDIPEDLPPRRYDAYVKGKVMIHYAAHWKPWFIIGTHKLRHLYFHYLKLSPKAQEPRYLPFRVTPALAFEFSKIRVKEWLYNFPTVLRFTDSIYRRTLSRKG